MIAAVKKDPNLKPPTASSMPALLVKYFERNFGGASLNIAHQKVVYFLEACLQYSDYPLLNFLRRCLVDGADIEGEEVPDVCIWLYVEAKNLLLSRQALFPGAPVAATGGGELDEFNHSLSGKIIFLEVLYFKLYLIY